MSWVLKFISLEWLFGLHSSKVRLQGWGEVLDEIWGRGDKQNRETMKMGAEMRKENS